MIGISVVLLAVDTPIPPLSDESKAIMAIFEVLCNLTFILEMSVKIVAFGFIQVREVTYPVVNMTF